MLFFLARYQSVNFKIDDAAQIMRFNLPPDLKLKLSGFTTYLSWKKIVESVNNIILGSSNGTVVILNQFSIVHVLLLILVFT